MKWALSSSRGGCSRGGAAHGIAPVWRAIGGGTRGASGYGIDNTQGIVLGLGVMSRDRVVGLKIGIDGASRG